MLGVLLLGLFTLELASAQMAVWKNPMPSDSHLLMPVTLGSGHSRQKRQAIEMTQPIRILPFYADDFDASFEEGKAALIRDDIIPKLLDFLEKSLKVAPLSDPILINNQCTEEGFFRDAVTGEIICANECLPTTMCGSFPVPTQHLKQCVQCRGSTDLSNCVAGTPAQDGEGVSGHDFVLYIMGDQSICPSSSSGSPTTLAFASACQNEVVQDRPVAGFVNFCPDAVRDGDPDFAFTVTKHEILHALAFASSLIPLWRDPANNEPRTPRNAIGLPNLGANNAFEISNTTVESVTYTDWLTASGRISHTVSRLITSAVRAEAQAHFDCPSLAGVELENQGGSGTALSHWEKRVLGNEAMTGVLTFNPVFSRFTFALLEDSGWYSVNYSLADELIWGRGAGCRFAEGSCREWIDTQNSNNQPTSPFCEIPNQARTSCTVDREAVSRCNLATFLSALPMEYQYFSSPQSGGSLEVADFCPFQDIFTIAFEDGTVRGTTCSDSSNTPTSTNLFLETYAPGSRCVEHGRQWTINNQQLDGYGGGCYQYSCSGDTVTITVATEEFTCTCTQAGEERIVDMTVDGLNYQGSIICPSCTQICHVPSSNIAPKDTEDAESQGKGSIIAGGGGDVINAACLMSYSQVLFALAPLLYSMLC